MAINKITTKSIKDLEISAADLAPGTITGAKIAPATVESSNIAPGTIANDRLANTGITINGTSIALGASGEIVAGTDWQAVTVADGSTLVNATAGQGLLLDTNAGVIEVVLPGSPSRGDTIKIVDYGGTFALNNCLVNLNGSFLDSTSLGYFNLSTNDTIAEFVYIDANKGWLFYQNSTQASTPGSALIGGQLGVVPAFTAATGGTVATSGDYKIHTFTGDGCFVVTSAGNLESFCGTPVAPLAGPGIVDYLVVAGGGGGGTGSWAGGGGGAGGFRESKSGSSGCWSASPLVTPTGVTITATTYPIQVGGGGAGGFDTPYTEGVQGTPSVFSTITSAGGGRGGSPKGPSPSPICRAKGGAGGSGGGSQGVWPESPACAPGGAGNTPPVSPPQGQPGGRGSNSSNAFSGGGGGGAGGSGGNGSGTTVGGPGGPGVTTSFNGTPTARAGGGGGSIEGAGSIGTGGSGGGGNGGSGGASTGDNGSANTGGGGGGAPTAGSGGKGIVILRYKFQ